MRCARQQLFPRDAFGGGACRGRGIGFGFRWWWSSRGGFGVRAVTGLRSCFLARGTEVAVFRSVKIGPGIECRHIIVGRRRVVGRFTLGHILILKNGQKSKSLAGNERSCWCESEDSPSPCGRRFVPTPGVVGRWLQIENLRAQGSLYHVAETIPFRCYFRVPNNQRSNRLPAFARRERTSIGQWFQRVRAVQRS